MTGASNKVFDYLACGLALLVSDLPDWNELFVTRGFAHSCDPQDPESIAAALRWFVQNPIQTAGMADRGQKRIASEWNYETQFQPLLRSILHH
jgi:glycosyltransferase involved in cell wall biosynthesis